MTQTQLKPRVRTATSRSTKSSKAKDSKKKDSPLKGRARIEFHQKLDARPIKEIWKRYEKSPTEDLRNYLIEKYLHLVRYNSERIYTRLPNEVDIEDLMSAGLFGLMDAIDAFDLARKVKFETYCAQRIRGAILD